MRGCRRFGGNVLVVLWSLNDQSANCLSVMSRPSMQWILINECHDAIFEWGAEDLGKHANVKVATSSYHCMSASTEATSFLLKVLKVRRIILNVSLCSKLESLRSPYLLSNFGTRSGFPLFYLVKFPHFPLILAENPLFLPDWKTF